MKTKIFAAGILLLALSACFTPIYRYSYVKETRVSSKTRTYTLSEVNIQNAELLLLDAAVLSNSLVNISTMVLANNAMTRTTNSDLGIRLEVMVEDNDIINNKQSLSLVYVFDNKGQEFARFILSSSSKDLLLNKSLLVKELNTIIKTVGSKIK